MKKIYLSLMLMVGLLASCDMDKKPYGSLDETTAIQSMNDLSRYRNYMYTSLRGITSGGWLTYSDIQMDQFHGLISNGNRVGIISNGIFTSSDGDLESMYAGCYSRIATANYMIEKGTAMAESGEFEAADVAKINLYKAEAYFLRAYCYFFLVDHFCQPYTAERAKQEGLGASIVTKYAPSGDVTTYPSRSTLDETYALIEADLAEAYAGMKAYEATDNSAVAANSHYLSSYAVAAMQARVALVKGDNATALNKAKEVINSGVYSLTTIDKYADLWTKDEGTEVIFRPFMSSTEGLVSTGSVWTSSVAENSADYIATAEVLMMYPENDVRFDTYFKVWNLDVEGTMYASYVFLKYPGNEALRTTAQNNYCNMTKPFRLSEMYLVAAEAAAVSGNTAEASKYLNDIRAQRLVGYEAQNYPAATVLASIKEERYLELIGEGFRMSDLRRWNEGFTRYPDHIENSSLNNVIVAAGRELTYEPGDHRFTWPIPKTEMDSNPNMEGQQNPGY